MPKQSSAAKTPKRERNISPDLLDQLLAECPNPEDITGPGGLLKRLTAAIVERALQGELTHQLGYGRDEKPPTEQHNRRNGLTQKTLRSNDGPMTIAVPRDRDGLFEPCIIPKHQRHFGGFDDKILSMYARGMSVRDIQAHLHEIYGVDVSPDLISKVTDEVLDELKAWQMRPLDSTYLVVYIDALMVKTREKTSVQNRAVYIAVGLNHEGDKDVLGLWVQATEGAKFWLQVLTELRQRGVKDILILCADGLKGLPEAAEASFPQAIFQTCIVHMVRSSMRYVSWKDRKSVCADLRTVYTAATVEAAEVALDEFEKKWGKQFPTIAPAWRARWSEIVPFLEFPPEIRRTIYTTNAIESLNGIIRKSLKTRGHMPNDEAALKLIYLAINVAKKTWGRRNRDWGRQLQQFVIYFGGRVPV
jgi:putative transposase